VGVSRSEFLIRGLDIPFGSAREQLAHRALERQRHVEYLKTLTIFNAIIRVGNSICATLSQSPQSSGKDSAGESLELLKGLLLPGETERMAEKTAKIKRLLQEENRKGPILVKAMDDVGRTNKARRRRR